MGCIPAFAENQLCMSGVNISGAEYGDTNGVQGQNYIYPSEKTVVYFSKKGFDTVRLPFLWERLQPQLFGSLNPEELEYIKQAVTLIRTHGMKIILDPHNYGYYNGKRLVTEDVPEYAFGDFWTRLALEFADQPDVYFGLMNEPHDIPVDAWLTAVNSAMAGIRAVGAKNMVLVPGTNWTGAHSWETNLPGGSNAEVMKRVVDPQNNFAFEFHQYMDEDFSGTHETCPNANAAVKALENVSAWLAENKKRGFLGEFGGSKDPACLAGIQNMTETLRQNSAQWLGFTYWAAGDWWPETESNNIQPTDKRDRPQLKWLGVQKQKTAPEPALCLSNL